MSYFTDYKKLQEETKSVKSKINELITRKEELERLVNSTIDSELERLMLIEGKNPSQEKKRIKSNYTDKMWREHIAGLKAEKFFKITGISEDDIKDKLLSDPIKLLTDVSNFYTTSEWNAFSTDVKNKKIVDYTVAEKIDAKDLKKPKAISQEEWEKYSLDRKKYEYYISLSFQEKQKYLYKTYTFDEIKDKLDDDENLFFSSLSDEDKLYLIAQYSAKETEKSGNREEFESKLADAQKTEDKDIPLLKADIEKLKQSINESRNAAKQLIERLENDKNNINIIKQQKETEKTEKEEKKEEIDNQISAKTTELSTITVLTNEEKNKKNARIEILNITKDAIDGQIDEINQKIETKKTELNSETDPTQKNNILSEISVLINDRTNKINSKAPIEKEIYNLQQELSSENKKTQLESEIENLKMQSGGLEEQINNLSTEITALDSQYTDIDTQIIDSETERANLKEYLNNLDKVKVKEKSNQQNQNLSNTLPPAAGNRFAGSKLPQKTQSANMLWNMTKGNDTEDFRNWLNQDSYENIIAQAHQLKGFFKKRKLNRFYDKAQEDMLKEDNLKTSNYGYTDIDDMLFKTCNIHVEDLKKLITLPEEKIKKIQEILNDYDQKTEKEKEITNLIADYTKIGMLRREAMHFRGWYEFWHRGAEQRLNMFTSSLIKLSKSQFKEKNSIVDRYNAFRKSMHLKEVNKSSIIKTSQLPNRDGKNVRNIR